MMRVRAEIQKQIKGMPGQEKMVYRLLSKKSLMHAQSLKRFNCMKKKLLL